MLLPLLLSLYPISFLTYALYSGQYTSMFTYFIGAYSLAYIIILGFLCKPDKAIYAYLLLWVVFPKFIRYLPLLGTFDLPGVSYFDIFHAIAALTLVITLLHQNSWRNEDIPRPLKKFYLLFFITAIITTVSSLCLLDMANISFVYPFEYNPFSRDNTYMFYGLIFFLAAMTFIKGMEQVEVILSIFMLSGVLLIIETIIISQLGLFPALSPWAFLGKGVFQSVFFLNQMWVGLFCIMGMSSFLYFIWKHHRFYLIPVALLFFLPALATYQKGILGGMLITLGTFGYFMIKKQIKVFIIMGVVLCSLATIWTEDISTFFGKARELLSGEVRAHDYWTEGTVTSRLGAYLRTMDVIFHFFPLGVGEGLGTQYLSSSVPDYFSALTPDSSSGTFYDHLVTGKHKTSTHNFYLHFVMEHGFLGIVVIISFIYLIYKNAALLKRDSSNSLTFGSRANTARICLYSILWGTTFFYMFDSSTRLYFI